jgi:hypothetical protein
MQSKEMGDVIFALKYCFEFYGKTLDKQQLQVWQNIIRSNSYNSVQWQTVLKQYFQVAKFAPKPPEILEMLAEERQHTQSRTPPPPPLTTNCPPDIADAWRYWIPKFWGQALPGPNTKPLDNPDKEDEYLMIVNREAKRTKIPEAIPQVYKLREVWGDE